MRPPAPRPIPALVGIDPETFRKEIVQAYRPVVLKGAVAHWPVVQAGRRSSAELCAYLKRFDNGAPVEAMCGAPDGRYFYESDLIGFNFARRRQTITAILDALLALGDSDTSTSIYAGSALIPAHLPDFIRENRLELVASDVAPRLWIGNRSSVAPHYDTADNLACVVGGRRRFTLFPPEQVQNLYVGPLDHTIAGSPASLVSVDEPDFERHPKFAAALEAAETADLEPGDAIYIPSTWWHAVRALEPVNALVNYWWSDAAGMAEPFEAMVHAIMGISALPPARQEAWRAMFDHYVFRRGGDPAAHLPADARGILGPLTPEVRLRIKAYLRHGLSRGERAPIRT